jgi:hypothetical protein
MSMRIESIADMVRYLMDNPTRKVYVNREIRNAWLLENRAGIIHQGHVRKILFSDCRDGIYQARLSDDN